MNAAQAPSRRALVAWSLVGFSVLVVALGIVAAASILAADAPTPNIDDSVGGDLLGVAGMGLLAVAAAALGAVIAVARPDNPGGPLLLGMGVLLPWFATSNAVADWSFFGNGPPHWFAMALAYLSAPGLFGSWTLAAIFALRFPTGDYLSVRGRAIAWVTVAGLAATSLAVFDPAFFTPDPARDVTYYLSPGLDNPLGIAALADLVAAAFQFGILGLFVGLFGGVASLVVRFLRSSGEERQQLKLVAFTTVAVAAMLLVGAQLNRLGGVFGFLWDNVLFGLLILVPISMAIALLRYRLYDIDVVINKTLVYATLAAFIAAVFAVVVLIPFLIFDISTDDGAASLVLPLTTTIVLVMVVQPVRERAQRLADRVVYGRKATPYEALSQFSSTVAGNVADDELLARMAEILAHGTGAETATVWLVDDATLRPAAAWPTGADVPDAVPLVDGSLPEFPGSGHRVEVVHQGRLLGALSITKAAGDPLRPIERNLLSDLAAQAGVVFRNFRLTGELLDRLAELQASRQRLVAAQDEERRRLERNLHDGAQQQLVSLKIKLGLARRIEDAAKKNEVLDTLMTEADEAVSSLRDLARGIYPPTLEQEGLVAALRAQAAKAPIPVVVQGTLAGRYSRDVESAVYFCTLEAMQNVAKYADATSVGVQLADSDGHISFSVTDDGTGFDTASVEKGAGLQNMEDRLAALGGTLTVTSAPGEGTTVAGSVPVASPVPQP